MMLKRCFILYSYRCYHFSFFSTVFRDFMYALISKEDMLISFLCIADDFGLKVSAKHVLKIRHSYTGFKLIPREM